MLLGELRKDRWHQIHALAALNDRGLQEVEKAAHGLQQRHVVEIPGDGQMETHVGLRGEIRSSLWVASKAEADFLLSASVARIAAYHAVLAGWRGGLARI
ncbi:hypothetical protein ACNKHQ_21005 [Shigella flexneri]